MATHGYQDGDAVVGPVSALQEEADAAQFLAALTGARPHTHESDNTRLSPPTDSEGGSQGTGALRDEEPPSLEDELRRSLGRAPTSRGASALPGPSPLVRAPSQGALGATTAAAAGGSRRRKAAKPQRADADPDVFKGGESEEEEAQGARTVAGLFKGATDFDLKREPRAKHVRAMKRVGPEERMLMAEAGTDVTEDGIRKSRRVPKAKKNDLYLDINSVTDDGRLRIAHDASPSGKRGRSPEDEDAPLPKRRAPEAARSYHPGARALPPSTSYDPQDRLQAYDPANHFQRTEGLRYGRGPPTVQVVETSTAQLVGLGPNPQAQQAPRQPATVYSIVGSVPMGNVPTGYSLTQDGRLIVQGFAAPQASQQQPQTYYSFSTVPQQQSQQQYAQYAAFQQQQQQQGMQFAQYAQPQYTYQAAYGPNGQIGYVRFG